MSMTLRSLPPPTHFSLWFKHLLRDSNKYFCYFIMKVFHKSISSPSFPFLFLASRFFPYFLQACFQGRSLWGNPSEVFIILLSFNIWHTTPGGRAMSRAVSVLQTWDVSMQPVLLSACIVAEKPSPWMFFLPGWFLSLCHFYSVLFVFDIHKQSILWCSLFGIQWDLSFLKCFFFFT